MGFLIHLKDSAFSQWLLESMLGFPTLIALHSVGMAVAVGLSLMVTLYLFEVFTGLEPRLIPRFLSIAVYGFLLNLATGLAIFITRGPEYIASGMFLLKMLLVAISATLLFWVKQRLTATERMTQAAVPDRIARGISLVSTAAFVGAVVTGRLIAYLSNLY